MKGELIVYDPTDKFIKWVINQEGIIYSSEKDVYEQVRKLTIKNYSPGSYLGEESYTGILGVAATFNDKPL